MKSSIKKENQYVRQMHPLGKDSSLAHWVMVLMENEVFSLKKTVLIPQKGAENQQNALK